MGGGVVPCGVAWQRACVNTSSLSLKCYLFWYMLWLTVAPLWPRIRMYVHILVVRPRWWAVEDAQIIAGKRAWIWHALGKWWICIYAQGFIWQACCHNIVCPWCCIHAYTNYPLGRCYRHVWGVEVSTCKGSCQPRFHCIWIGGNPCAVTAVHTYITFLAWSVICVSWISFLKMSVLCVSVLLA